MSSRLRVVSLSVAMLAIGLGSALLAQNTDSTRVPTAAFVGRIISSIDSTPVRSADIRLFFLDSVHAVHARNGSDSLELFADTARSRVGVTDSTGAFAIRRLEPGRYLLSIRRLGYTPQQGALVVDTGIVRTTVVMEQVSKLLAKVVVTESSVDRVKQRLDQNGFVQRSHLGIAATFVDRAEILRRKPQTVADILSAYGIYDGTFMLDRIPVDYDMLRNYPADLVIGLEIYRHQRPTEFNMTRSAPGILSPGGQAAAMQALIVIWTYVP
jgi:hypothetical protein